jgi:hypothetical protein
VGSTQVRSNQIFDNDLTSDDIADAAIRGATGNAGTQREIATGTVSTPDLRDDAVSAAKLLDTDSFTMGALSLGNASGNTLVVNATDLIVDSTNHKVSIGASVPSASSLLTLTSTTKGFLPTRMTTTQRDAIATPAEGMLIYNTTTGRMNVYTTSWGDLIATDSLALHTDGSNSPTANINWNQFQITNLVIHTGSSLPGSPVEGQVFYLTTTKQWMGYNGTAWVLLG